MKSGPPRLAPVERPLVSNTRRRGIDARSVGARGESISRRLALETLYENSQLRGLRCIFDAWMQASLDRAALPARLPVAEIRAGGMLGNLHIFDVTASDPGEFFAIWWGANAAINDGREGLFDRVGQLGSATYSRWGVETLQRTKQSAKPLLECVSSRHLTGTPPRHRLLLPLSDDGTRVDRVISAWSYFTMESII